MNARSNLLRALTPAACLLPLAACIVVVDGKGNWHHHDGSSYATTRGSGVCATQSRTVSDFRRIVVEGSADVVAKVGATTSLAVTGDDNLIDSVTTEIRDGTLHIGMKPGSYSSKVDLHLDLVSPAIESISIRGSSDVEVLGLSGQEFTLEIRGSGDARAAGKVDRLEANVSGSGDMHLYDLETREARVAIAGSGDVETWATESLSVSIAGSGDVRYKGGPKVNKSIAGSGNVSATVVELP